MKSKHFLPVLLFSLLSMLVSAQVTYDNVANGFADNVTTFTLSNFTVSPGSELLVVVHWQGSNFPTSVTFDGNNMTVQEVDKFWYLTLGSTATTGDVVFSFAAATTGIGVAISFSGVSQATPLGTVQTQSTVNGTNTQAISSQAGDLVVDFISGLNTGGGCTVPDLTVGPSPQVERLNASDTPTGFCARLGVSTNPGAASVDMEWTAANAGSGDFHAFNINQHVSPNNVGIGTLTPDGSAALDIQSTTQGVLVPRLTSAERSAIATPANGLMVYDSDLNAFFFHNGTAWTEVIAGDSNDDADADPTNELITSGTLNGTDLEITDAGGTTTVDLSSLAGGESTTVTDGTTIDLTLTGADISAETILDPDAGNILTSSASGLLATEVDGSTTNELITSGTLNGTDLEITDAGGTTTVDLSSLAGGESTTVTDGTTIDLTLTGADISAETILDPDAGNILTSSASGLLATEVDGSTTNELITGGNLNGTDLEITDAGGTTTVDLSSLAGGESTTVTDGTTIDLTLTGADISAETILDPDAGNILTSSASGLLATEVDPEVGANTTNYLPKWDGSALIQSTSVFEDGSGNVGIGTSTPDPSAALDIKATDKGMLVPRMANSQIAAISNPATGLQVYSTDDGCFHIYDGTRWMNDCPLRFETGNLPPLGPDNWTQLNDFPAGFEDRASAVSFVVSGEAYVGTGISGVLERDLWKYDPAADSWTQLNDFPAGFNGRLSVVSFVIGGEAYVGTGSTASTAENDLWKYDPAADSWTQLNDFPAGFDGRGDAVAFILNGDAYVGTGQTGTGVLKKDLWKYDPVVDSWTQLNDFPTAFDARGGAVSFVVGGMAYLGTGWIGSSNYKKDLWKYDPTADSWAQLNDLPTAFDARTQAVSFVVGGEAYIGTGVGGGFKKKDLWKYDPSTDSWMQLNSFPVNFDERTAAISFVVGGEVYVGTGGFGVSLGRKKDLWKYKITSPYLMTVNTDGSASWIDPTNSELLAEEDPEVGANTTNYLPKWDGSQLVQSTSVFEDGSGKVGIGTDMPQRTLQVATDFRVGTGAESLVVIADTPPAVTVGGSTEATVLTTAGTGSSAFHLGIEIPSNDPDDGFYIATDANSDGTVDNLAVKVKANGNVGIGTNNPVLRLHVDGGSDVEPASGGYFQSGSTAGFNIAMDNNEIMARNNGAVSPLYLNNNGGDVIINAGNATGNMGIGLPSPIADLHIKQNEETPGGSGGIRLERPGTTDNWKTYVDAAQDYNFSYNGTLRAWIYDTDGTYHNTSDRRLKKNIEPLPSVLPQLLQLRPVRYHFLDVADNTTKTFGLIAQEVQPLFPDVVGEKNGYLSMNYGAMGIITIQAIQEQQAMIEKLQMEVEELQSQLTEMDALKARMARLEAALLVPNNPAPQNSSDK